MRFAMFLLLVAAVIAMVAWTAVQRHGRPQTVRGT